MYVKINGKKTKVSSKTVKAMLKELDIDPVGKLVSINGKMCEWTRYQKTRIAEGDTIDILRFIAGG